MKILVIKICGAANAIQRGKHIASNYILERKEG